MKKTNFLVSSFEKALNKPKTSLFKDFILCYRSSRSGFIFTDRSECNFAPYFIKTPMLKVLLSEIKKDIKRNKSLKAEIETFNRYYSENVVIENSHKKTAYLSERLGVHTLSRQSAQMKCITATIFPVEFFNKIPETVENFAAIKNQLIKIFKKNKKAIKTAIIDDFIFWYDKIMNQFSFWDLFCPQNKKILRRRIREIINTLSDKQPLPADFADGKVFKKPFSVFSCGENYRARYVDSLLFLSEKIMLMRNYADLLELAHEKVQNSADFDKELQYFHNVNYSPDLDDIIEIRNSAQSLYEKFAKICYLNAITKSFEIFYAVDNPIEQNSALPSVAPDKEIKKIEKIVERTKEIAAKGRLAVEYNSAMHDFEHCHENIQTVLKRYNAEDTA